RWTLPRLDVWSVRTSSYSCPCPGRIGLLVAPGGERSFVADRRAADRLTPDDVKADWFERVELVHLPAYSLLGEPLGRAGLRAIELGPGRGAVVSADLASIGPPLSNGRRAAGDLISSGKPDVLFATEPEAEALLGRYAADGLLEYARIAVIKRGQRGARVVAREDGVEEPLRFDIATPSVT